MLNVSGVQCCVFWMVEVLDFTCLLDLVGVNIGHNSWYLLSKFLKWMHYWISYALQEHLILVNRNTEYLFMILPFPYYGAALFPGLLLLVSL